MFAPVFLTLHRAILLVVLAVALTATGFAHRAPTAQDDALAFALANGAGAADFCGDIPGSEGRATLHCSACQITASADLPQAMGKRITLTLAVHAQVIAPRLTFAPRRILDPGHSPQAPPVA